MRSSNPENDQSDGPQQGQAVAPGESIETLKRYFEHLFANSRDIMNLFSLTEGRVVMLNAAAEEATGYNLVQLQTLPIDALYPVEEHAKLQLAFERLQDTGFSSDKLCMYARNGELRDIWTRSYVVQRAPETVCIVHTIDVTEENRKRERELRDATLATLGEASATLAHELKNALQSMQFSLATLRAQLSSAGATRTEGSLARLERAAAHMDDVISGIERAVHHKKAGGAFLSVPAAVQNATLLLQGYLDAKRIELQVELGPALPLVWCHQPQLEQILVVLLKNAAQAMASRPQRRLRISVDDRGDRLRLDVADTGGGLPEEIERNIFEAFRTTKPAGLGQGLGLATAKQLALDNDIAISVVSERGVGTTFSLEFRTAASAEQTRDSAALSGRVILLVGDDPELVDRALCALQEAGARVLTASSSAEALQLLRVHAVAAVVCEDAMFPVHGRQFVLEARKHYRGPICLVVDDRQQYTVEELVGVSSVLTKPLGTRALVVGLDALLA